MKCPNCYTDIKGNLVSEGTKCPKCSYVYVFSKPNPLGVTDIMFQKMMDKTSSEDEYKFLGKQLYYQVLKARYTPPRGLRHPALILFLQIILAALLYFIFNEQINWFLIKLAQEENLGEVFTAILGFAVFSFYLYLGNKLSIRSKPRRGFSFMGYSEFEDQYIARFDHYHPMKNLIRKPESDKINGRTEKDIQQYGFDFLIVCDQKDTMQMLYENDVHFEKKSAICTIDQEPKPLFHHFIRQVKKNPMIPVLLIHNASDKGLSIYKEVWNEWFEQNDQILILDLGINPAAYLKNRKIFIPIKTQEKSAIDPSQYSNRSKKEIQFLYSGQIIELANLIPQKIVATLSAVMGRYHQAVEEKMQSTADQGRSAPLTSATQVAAAFIATDLMISRSRDELSGGGGDSAYGFDSSDFG